MGDLSPHFSQLEFACRHCGRTERVPTQLLAVLERIRAITGKPLVIVSGYRCPVHNRAVGGAPGSQHLLGAAADIPQRRASRRQAQKAGAVGVGHKNGWATHVDVRAGGPAEWSYDD